MRARVAYISSFGTTAILVAAALLMLAVVGAIVTFRGWPGAANADGVQSVPLTPSFTRADARLVVTRVHRASALVRGATRPVAARSRAGRLSTAGLVKVVGPSTLPGVVKVTGGPGPGMHPVFPAPQQAGPLSSFPPPSGRNPVTVPVPTASSGGGSGGSLPLPDSGTAATVTGEVSSVAGGVGTEVPSPPAPVETVRGLLPIH
jgi:hypothetical protein